MRNDTHDMHSHTNLSDAAPTESPRVVCKAAKAAGVGHLAITDHDRLLPEPLRQELMRTFDLDIIPGCEFNAVTQIDDRQVTVHILGLWLPTANPPEVLQSVLLKNQNQDFPAYCKAMLKKLLKIGIDPSGKGVEQSFELLRAVNPDSGHLGKNAVAHLLVETGYAKDSHEAKKLYLSQFGRRLAFVSADDYCHYAPMEDVMNAANLGLSVLCHLYYYRLTPEQNEVLIKQFKAMGGQALEVDYGHYSDERKAELLGYCKKYELLPVASSDRHEADTPFKLGDPEWYRALHERYLSLHGELSEEYDHGTDILHQ